MELYFGAQYVTVTSNGLNESANLDDDKNLLATKMEKLFTVDPSILTHVLDPSQYALTEPVKAIIDNVTDSSKDEVADNSEIENIIVPGLEVIPKEGEAPLEKPIRDNIINIQKETKLSPEGNAEKNKAVNNII